jgi:hypothetical protein
MFPLPLINLLVFEVLDDPVVSLVPSKFTHALHTKEGNKVELLGIKSGITDVSAPVVLLILKKELMLLTTVLVICVKLIYLPL